MVFINGITRWSFLLGFTVVVLFFLYKPVDKRIEKDIERLQLILERMEMDGKDYHGLYPIRFAELQTLLSLDMRNLPVKPIPIYSMFVVYTNNIQLMTDWIEMESTVTSYDICSFLGGGQHFDVPDAYIQENRHDSKESVIQNFTYRWKTREFPLNSVSNQFIRLHSKHGSTPYIPIVPCYINANSDFSH